MSSSAFNPQSNPPFAVYDFRGLNVDLHYDDAGNMLSMPQMYCFSGKVNAYLSAAGAEPGEWRLWEFTGMEVDSFERRVVPSSPLGLVFYLNIPNPEAHLAALALLFAESAPHSYPLIFHLVSDAIECASGLLLSLPITPSDPFLPAPPFAEPVLSSASALSSVPSNPNSNAEITTAAGFTVHSTPQRRFDPCLGPPQPGDSIGGVGEVGSGTLGGILLGEGLDGTMHHFALTNEHVVHGAPSKRIQRPSADDLEGFVTGYKKRIGRLSDVKRRRLVEEVRQAATSFGQVEASLNSCSPWPTPPPLPIDQGVPSGDVPRRAIDFALVAIRLGHYGTPSPTNLSTHLSVEESALVDSLTNGWDIPASLPPAIAGDHVLMEGRTSVLIEGQVLSNLHGGVSTKRGAGFTCEFAVKGRHGQGEFG